jgi:hypothetical protein
MWVWISGEFTIVRGCARPRPFQKRCPFQEGPQRDRRSNGSETADRMGGGAFPESRRSASGSTNRPAVPVPSGEGLGDEEPRL